MQDAMIFWKKTRKGYRYLDPARKYQNISEQTHEIKLS